MGTVAAELVTADFDNDVDGRDFLVWQRGGSPDPLGADDLELWQEQYGRGPLIAAMSVPEPSNMILLATAVPAVLRRSLAIT